MLLLRSILADTLIFILMMVMGILCLPAVLWSQEATYRVMKLYCRFVFAILKGLCGIHVEIRGTVPTGDVLVASKHQSFLDIMMHMHALPRARYIMKAEIRWVPVLGIYAWRIGSTPVSRGKKGQAVTRMLIDVEKRKEPGQLVIYPQGTRVLPGVHMRYKVGAGVLYQRGGVTCVPAATNTGVFWARRAWLRHPGTAVVAYLDPIPPGMELEAFMEKLEAAVEPASDALMAEAGFNRP